MRMLAIHSDFIEYLAKEKAIDNAEELKEKGPFRVKDCLVVFVTAEKYLGVHSDGTSLLR